ncbi:MAG TPA: YfhO family protein [Bryobacteraceae bacterium]
MMRFRSTIRAIGRGESFRAIAILIGVLHIPFSPCIWGNKTLMASSQDAPSITASGAWYGPPAGPRFSRTLDNGGGGLLGEPNLLLLRHQYFVEHVPPLWNPYQAYGAPLAANQQSQPFYPLTVALLLHIGPRSYNWFLLARLLLAGMGSYFFLRFFVSFWAGIAGGITSMLAGYYILFLTMPQLSVEVLVPASLWAAEYLLRKCDYRSFVSFAVILLLVFLGGMPESDLMLCTLLYSYLLFRIVSDASLRASWLLTISRVAAGTVVGLALAAFFLLPFWEFMHRSFDLHQLHNVGGGITGVSAEPFGLSVFTYLFPLLFGPPFQGVFGIRNYVGLVAVFLLIIAVIAAALPERRRLVTDDTRSRAITWFFFCFTILLLAKRYGLPGLNAIGNLPFFQMLNFSKYEEALLSICVSILGAIGVERLLRHQLSVRVQAIALVATALLIPLARWLCRENIRHEIADLHVRAIIPYIATLVASIAILWLGTILVFSWRHKFTGGIDVPLGIGVAALLAAEMSSNFILPTHYWHNKLAHMEHNAFSGAPYVDVLKRVTGNWRIFARDGWLFPDWASAFQLYDIRNLDAMYEKKYLPFVQAFFSGQRNNPADLSDRFTGSEDFNLGAPLAQRLLQLSSVKYIASIRPFTTPNAMIDEMMKQNRGHLIPGKEAAIAAKEFILSGEARDALGEHPPYKRMPYRIRVPNDPRAIFQFSYALDPAVFDKNGDGVGFLLEVKDPSGAITQKFSRYIDPKHNPRERRWMDGEVDLSAYYGQTVDLLFTTTAGPKGDSTYDWAAWSNFHFAGQPLEPAPPFHLIYNAEAKIYRYDHPLPRAAIYHQAALARGENDTLRKLADPALDVFQTVVLDESSLTDVQRARVADINRQAPAPVESASIRSYESQDVQIEASLDRAGILVLNDTAYPGWVVDVDGKAASWIDANYLFRGVLLSSGKHIVRFRYRPASFRRGAAVSGLAFAGLVVGGLLRRKRPHAAA